MTVSSHGHTPFYMTEVGIDGDVGVGKTALEARLTYDTFVEGYEKTIDDVSSTVTWSLNGGPEKVRYAFFEISGINREQAYRPKFVSGIILTYRIDSRGTFEVAKSLLAQMKEKESCDSTPTILVATQTDRIYGREVSEGEGRELAENIGVPFFEVSSKTGTNAFDALDALGSMMITRQQGYKVPSDLSRIQEETTDSTRFPRCKCVIN